MWRKYEIMKLCDYGCGNEAHFQLKNGKWCCSKHYTSCPCLRKKNSEGCKNALKLGKRNGCGIKVLLKKRPNLLEQDQKIPNENIIQVN